MSALCVVQKSSSFGRTALKTRLSLNHLDCLACGEASRSVGEAVGAAWHVDGVRIAIQARCVVADGEEVAGAYRLLIVSKNLHVAVDVDTAAGADDDGLHPDRIERRLADGMDVLGRLVELRVNSGIRCCVVLVDGLLQGFCADAHLCGQVGDGVGFGNVGVSLGKSFPRFPVGHCGLAC